MFLFLVAIAACVAVGLHGVSYYLTPLHERPFRPDHDVMKPSGTYSHGLGIVGATMIVVGVSLYSTRKRIRSLWKIGRLSVWLQIHIFLCLVGPILVIFHTTFKAGGVAAISLWTMLAVWSSGMIGRFLYGQIPRNIQGAELSVSQINAELERMGTILATTSVGVDIQSSIDSIIGAVQQPDRPTRVVAAVLQLRRARRTVGQVIRGKLAGARVPHSQAHQIHRLAAERAALLQKTILLEQVGRLFHNWHAIHLPFTVIMFITLAAHVTVSILLGYTWIF